jgi:hypothetical protein
VKIPHLESQAVPIVDLEGDQLLGVGVEIVSVMAWAVVESETYGKFVRMAARNADGDMVLGIPLPPTSAVALADQLRAAAAEAAK